MNFDVFLSHNSADKPAVEEIARKLKDAGLEPWLDKWCLTPGETFQPGLADGLRNCMTCAIFIGPKGLGNWAREELLVAQDRAAKEAGYRLIPILLPGVRDPFDYSRLPPFLTQRTWIDFRGGLDGERPLRVLVNAIKGKPPGPDITQGRADDTCPYQGLEVFDEANAEFFFGRERDVQRLVEKLKATRFLAVLGASGSGKSSLVRAGLIPALRDGALPQSEGWTICVFKPGSRPLTTLTAQLLHVCPGKDSMQNTLDQMGNDERTFHLAVALALANKPGARIVWMVDQFEEVFTLCSDEKERGSFLRNLLYASSIPDGQSTVLLTMRADFLPKCAVWPDLAARIAAQQFLVSPMDADMLRQVIEEPAFRVRLGFEPGLADIILGDIASEPGALPLLEHALLELWKRRRDHTLTLDSYRESGGVKGAIAKTAEEIFKTFNPDEQTIVRRIMLRLTQLGEGTEDTRRRATMDEIVTSFLEVDAVERVVKAMADARLLTTSSSNSIAAGFLDVSHEALIRGWPRLRRWLDEDRAGLRLHRRITETAKEWQGANRDDDLLDRGARLIQAQEWTERHETELNSLEREFLNASTALKHRLEQGKIEQQQRELQAALAAERKISEIASRGNVSLARYSRERGMNGQALAHFAQALRLNPENGEASDFTAAMLTQLTWHVPLARSMRHDAGVYSAQFSPDGRRVVTASGDKSARLWDALSGKPIGEPMKHEESVVAAQFSPDNQRVVTASFDRTARLWDALSGKPIGELMKHGDTVYSAEFSADNQRVVTASADKTARLWDALSGKPIGEPMKHDNIVYSAQFSADNQRVVTASFDKSARLWDALSGKPIGEPMKHEDFVNSAQFSPDNQRVVTASGDKSARLWDALSGKPIGELMKHENFVNSAQFSADNQRVVTASGDKTARLWDALSGKPIGEPMKHEDFVNSAQFSADNQRVVTASRDGTARLWDALSGKPIGEPIKHEDTVYSAEFSADDNQRVVTASGDRTARLWDAASGKPIGELMKHEESVYSAQFSLDGQRVVTASGDKTARLWDALNGKPIGEPMKHKETVYSARFSPDNQRVVTASFDKSARLWDALSGKPIGEPMKHEESVYSAEFSPDSQRVVTGSFDKSARLWDALSGKPIGEPMKHEESVVAAQFSPDNQRVVTASADKSARLWDALSGKPISEPMKHEDTVYSAQFSSDNQRVVTASADKSARLWDALSGKPIGEPMKHEDTVYSAEFSPDNQRVVTGSRDRTARLWDAASGKPIGEPMKHENFVNSAQFSADNRRVVTASKDRTARLWDAASGKPIGEPMKHKDFVYSAQFSPDNQRVVTGSFDKTARLWDLPAATSKDTREDILLLSALSETMGGFTLESGDWAENLTPLTSEPIGTIREKIAAKLTGVPSNLSPLQRFLKWSVADRRSRTISPFSQITVPEWLENRIKEGTVEGLRAAMQVDPANARITAHLGRRLADQALKQLRAPDETRRDRREADFLTSRALKLAPDSEEVKKLRDAVIKLLELETN